MASRLGYHHMIDLIMDQPGCGDANAKGDGQTPIFLAMWRWNNDQTIAKLIQRGACVDMQPLGTWYGRYRFGIDEFEAHPYGSYHPVYTAILN